MNQDQHNLSTEQIWRELSDRLRQFVRSRINSTIDVDDILQTVFLRIHTKIDTLQNVDRLESWVFQITRNAISDHCRQKQDLENNVELLISNSDTDVKENIAGELAGCLASLIHKLPENQQRALSLYELEGVSQKEIAKRESITLSGTKSRIQRGRKSLEGLLKACCEFQFDRRGNFLEYQVNNPDCCSDQCK